MGQSPTVALGIFQGQDGMEHTVAMGIFQGQDGMEPTVAMGIFPGQGGMEPRCCHGNFSRSRRTCDFKTDTLVAVLPGAWRYRVGWPGVSTL